MSADRDFWGHVDFRFSGTERSIGGPIGAGSLESLSQQMGRVRTSVTWAIFDTLSNRGLAVRLDQIQSVFVIDDAGSWPAGERSWETRLDDYAGMCLDTYRALAMWVDNDPTEWMVSQSIRNKALAMVKQGGFLENRSELRALLRHTVVHFTDGSSTSYQADRQQLSELSEAVEAGDTDLMLLREYDCQFEQYINLGAVRAIEVPLIELLADHDES